MYDFDFFGVLGDMYATAAEHTWEAVRDRTIGDPNKPLEQATLRSLMYAQYANLGAGVVLLYIVGRRIITLV